jgi:hypothetical protein
MIFAIFVKYKNFSSALSIVQQPLAEALMEHTISM